MAADCEGKVCAEQRVPSRKFGLVRSTGLGSGFSTETFFPHGGVPAEIGRNVMFTASGRPSSRSAGIGFCRGGPNTSWRLLPGLTGPFGGASRVAVGEQEPCSTGLVPICDDNMAPQGEVLVATVESSSEPWREWAPW
jgi:hypothetical protein